MKMQHIATGLTIINLAIMVLLFTKMQPAKAQEQPQEPLAVLRGRALEIVDSLGKIRASITIQPPVEMEGKKYPQTVLLRLIDTKGGPVVKLAAGDNSTGLNLSDESGGGVLIRARDTGSFIKISNKEKERVFQP
ncbi:MAG: hypothetical protein QM791_20260 [Ferruginibacter sp.]